MPQNKQQYRQKTTQERLKGTRKKYARKVVSSREDSIYET